LGEHQQHECLERLATCRHGCGLRIVAHRLPRHELEWCEAPEVVALRGLAVRARKLRRYQQTWTLAESEKPVPGAAPGGVSNSAASRKGGKKKKSSQPPKKKRKKPAGLGLGDDDDDDDDEEDPFVSVRRDPFTLVKKGLILDLKEDYGGDATEEP